MRKRPIAQKMDDSDPSNEESTTQVCTSACLSVWHSFLSLDQRFTTHLALCATKESPLGHLRPLMKILEISCHGVPWISGSVFLFLCSHKSQDVMVSVNMFFALMFDLVLVGLLKAIFQRSRPSFNLTDMFIAPAVDKFSFPSGHATRALMMGLFLCFHIFTNYICILLTVLWSLSVSISRILLGRHHIFDVVCGILIGILSYFIYLRFWIPEETSLVGWVCFARVTVGMFAMMSTPCLTCSCIEDTDIPANILTMLTLVRASRLSLRGQWLS